MRVFEYLKGINRIRLEFKGMKPKEIFADAVAVLIESDWNLKEI